MKSRGFTLIEIMIALALAGLVVGGALQLHASFNRHAQRQNEIADMQQTLRVAMMMMEREIRRAGAGLPGGHIEEGHGAVGCTTATARLRYGFQWWNKNASRDDSTDFQTATTTPDPDPDSFAVIFAPQAVAYADSDPGAALSLRVSNPQPDLSLYAAGTNAAGKTLFVITFPPEADCVTGKCWAYDPTLPLAARQINRVMTRPPGSTIDYESYSYCIRELSDGPNAGGSGGVKILQHDSTKSHRCFNPAAASDLCAKAVNDLKTKSGGSQFATVRVIQAQSTMFRVMTVDDPLNQNGVTGVKPSPKLTTRTAPWGTAGDDPTAPWTVIAENIDDMQIALVMRDGTVQSRLDNPAVYLSSDPIAVRVTLQARSSSPVAGLNAAIPRSAEDGAVSSPTILNAEDPSQRYLRRQLTAEIELRNMTPANP